MYYLFNVDVLFKLVYPCICVFECHDCIFICECCYCRYWFECTIVRSLEISLERKKYFVFGLALNKNYYENNVNFGLIMNFQTLH